MNPKLQIEIKPTESPEVVKSLTPIGKLAEMLLGEAKGDKGDTPTEEQLLGLIQPLIPMPIKGDKGDPGDVGSIGETGKDGVPGKNGVDGKDGKPGKNGKDGKDGKDGSPDTIEQLKEKVEKAGINYDSLSNKPNLEVFMGGSRGGTSVADKALSELTDVRLSSVANNEVLKFNTTTNKWENGTAATPMSDVAYDATSWNANLDGATKNAIRDKIESMSAGVGMKQIILVPMSDDTTALTTGTSKYTFRMPFAGTLNAVRSNVITAPTGASVIVDINVTGTGTILSTKLSIDATAKTSVTSIAPAVISGPTLADDAEVTLDIDQVGSTIAGAGLKIALYVTPTA